jgi:hypothetical protein
VGGIARLGHLLEIRSPIRQIFSQGVKWLVAADGGYPSRRPLHSLAVSLQTGELIYHDRRNTRLPSSRGPLDRSAAVAAARLWLTRLGWPGARMPLLSFRNVATAPKVRKVVFGWLQVGPVATPGATLWVTPDHSIIEAWVWPPVARAGTIPARSILAAWDDLRAGRLPLAVEGMSPGTSAGGSGSVQRVSVVSILAPSADRHLYLVPAYRFGGSAHIQGSATSHRWYALAPGAQK